MYDSCDLSSDKFGSNQPFISFLEVVQNIAYLSLNLNPTQPKIDGLECQK